MPRDANGNYTNANAPVNAGETILASTYNTENDDKATELTDSLSRSGKGGMLSPLKAIDGTLAAPGMTFAGEPGSGLHRSGPGDMRVQVLGQTALYLAANETFGNLNGYRLGKISIDGSLQALITSIGSAVTMLQLYPEPWPVSASFTIPSNITLVTPRGVDIQIASGQTLTINGDFVAGVYRVFSGDGLVAGFGKVAWALPEWWGAPANGTDDDSAAMEKATAAAPRVGLFSDSYKLASTVSGTASRAIEGRGATATTITCTAGGFDFNVSDIRLKGFKLQGPGYWQTSNSETTTVLGSPSTNAGIQFGDGLSYRRGFYWEDVRVDGFKEGLALEKVYDVDLGARCRITNCQYGVYAFGADATNLNLSIAGDDIWLDYNGFNWFAKWCTNLHIGHIVNQHNRNYAGIWMNTCANQNIASMYCEYGSTPADLVGIAHPSNNPVGSTIWDSDSSTGIKHFVHWATVSGSSIGLMRFQSYRLGMYMRTSSGNTIGQIGKSDRSDLTLGGVGYDATIMVYSDGIDSTYNKNLFTGGVDPIIPRNQGIAALRGGFTLIRNGEVIVEADIKRTVTNHLGRKRQLNTNGLTNWTNLSDISDGDTTPSLVADVSTTSNTTPITITHFDDMVVGETYTVRIGDANTTIDFTGTNLKGNGGADWSPANGDYLTCWTDGTNVYCNVVDAT